MQIQGKYRCINCFKELNDEDEICSCRYSLSDYKLLSHWWLRSPVSNNDDGHSASFVDYDGSLDHKFSLNYEIVGVRPIINVDLSNF